MVLYRSVCGVISEWLWSGCGVVDECLRSVCGIVSEWLWSGKVVVAEWLGNV